MLVVFARTLILYTLVVIVMRVMGKRQIGQLQPFELVVAILISELAAVPMQNTGIPLINGIIPILTLLMAQIAISVISLKSTKARAIICGKPAILIENGKIKEDEIRREMYTLTDLLEQLRIKNVPNIADVEYAILETNGQLSIIPKSQKRPLCPEDLKVETKYEGLPLTLIIDGEVNDMNLKKAGLDRDWLRSELSKFDIHNFDDVLFASLDTSGNLYYQQKSRKEH
ncbi:MAG TPA: DUF421 domain-containing protein [Clostridiaceae bacterium]|nr:DUF421 domain-containing protein [Clostridiaceae bacterium]